MMLALVVADTRLGAAPPASHPYWRNKAALCGALFLTQLVQYVEAELHLQSDPSFTYENSGIFLGCALLEAALVLTWLGWLGWQLGRAADAREARSFQGRAATAFALAALWLVIWVRESYTFKARRPAPLSLSPPSHPTPSPLSCPSLPRSACGLCGGGPLRWRRRAASAPSAACRPRR